MPRKGFGGDDRAAELACDLFEPRRQIHRWADTSEIQAVAAADIAVEHIAQMQREAEAHARDRRDLRPRFVRRGKRLGAGSVGIRLFGHGKNRQQPVAHVFQHLAAMLGDRRDLAIEISD